MQASAQRLASTGRDAVASYCTGQDTIPRLADREQRKAIAAKEATMEDNKRIPEGVERLDNEGLSQVSGGKLVGQLRHVKCSKCGADYTRETSMMSEPPHFCRECDARIRAEFIGFHEER